MTEFHAGQESTVQRVTGGLRWMVTREGKTLQQEIVEQKYRDGKLLTAEYTWVDVPTVMKVRRD